MKEFPISLLVTEKKLFLKMPKNGADVDFVRSLRYCRWNGENFDWEIPNYPGNLDKIKRHFGERISHIEEASQPEPPKQEFLIPEKGQVYLLKEKGRLTLRFQFHEDLIKAVKQIPFYRWDTAQKHWSLPYSPKYEQELRQKITEFGLELIFKETDDSSAEKRTMLNTQAFTKTCPTEYIQKLQERRYSPQTLKTYSALFTEFINFFPDREEEDLDEKDVMDFSTHLVVNRKVSSSYQNQAINAIKFYFEIEHDLESFLEMIIQHARFHVAIKNNYNHMKRLKVAQENSIQSTALSGKKVYRRYAAKKKLLVY